jgi:adhesin HecA-like repeat protein
MRRMVLSIDRLVLRSARRLDERSFASDMVAELKRQLATRGATRHAALFASARSLRIEADGSLTNAAGTVDGRRAGASIARRLLR